MLNKLSKYFGNIITFQNRFEDKNCTHIHHNSISHASEISVVVFKQYTVQFKRSLPNCQIRKNIVFFYKYMKWLVFCATEKRGCGDDHKWNYSYVKYVIYCIRYSICGTWRTQLIWMDGYKQHISMLSICFDMNNRV